MGVVRSIATVKEKLEDRGKTCMLPGYAQNNTGVTYRMLNICTKCIVISCDFIWLNKNYGEYVSRKENTKANNYILQEEDDSYNWAHVKKYFANNEVKTKTVKQKKMLRPIRILGRKKTYRRISISFLLQNNKIK